MLVLRPDYFDDFKCIAERCPESCCMGWKISVDKLSFRKYREIKGSFGKYLNHHIVRDRKGGDTNYARMLLDEHKRCSLLDENNLCRIYINLGEKYLCNVCTRYPRIINRYGERYEISATISCPEIARLVVTHEQPITFNMTEEEVPPAHLPYTKYSEEYGQQLWDIRSLCIDIAQYRSIPTWKRLVFIKQAMVKLENALENHTYSAQDLEILTSYVANERSAQIMDEMNVDRQIKRKFITDLITYRKTLGGFNSNFNNRIDNCIELFKKNNYSSEEIEQLEAEFEIYMSQRDYILENYIVCYIFSRILSALWSHDLQKEVNMLIIHYISIKHILFVEWLHSNKQLKQQDYIDIVYSFSRGMEHSKVYLQKIEGMLKGLDVNKVITLVTLLA